MSLANVLFDTCGAVANKVTNGDLCSNDKDGAVKKNPRLRQAGLKKPRASFAVVDSSKRQNPSKRHSVAKGQPDASKRHSILKGQPAYFKDQPNGTENEGSALTEENVNNLDSENVPPGPNDASFHSAYSSDEDIMVFTNRRVSVFQSAVDVLAASMKLGDKLIPDKNDDEDDAEETNMAPLLAQKIRERRKSTGVQLVTAKSFESCVNDCFEETGSQGGEAPSVSTCRIGFNTYLRKDPSEPATSLTQWHSIPGAEFEVREKGYNKTKRKVPSEDPLYDTVGIDVLTTADGPLLQVASRLVNTNCQIKDTPPGTPGKPQIPAIFIMNFIMPSDDDGVSFCIYGVLSERYYSLIGTDKEPAQLRLLRKIISLGHMTSELTFKLIAKIVDIDSYSLPSTMKKFNGKPAKIAKTGNITTGKMTQLPGNPSYIELSVDVRKWGWIVRTSIATMRLKMENMCFNTALLIEGQDEEFQPEQCLITFCCRRPSFRNVFIVPRLENE